MNTVTLRHLRVPPEQSTGRGDFSLAVGAGGGAEGAEGAAGAAGTAMSGADHSDSEPDQNLDGPFFEFRRSGPGPPDAPFASVLSPPA